MIRGRLLVALLGAAVLVASAAVAPPPAAAAGSLALRASYEVEATLGWAARTLQVRTVAHVTNGTPEAVDGLVFNLLPIRIGKLVLGEVLVGEEAVAATAAAQSLKVPLPAPLEPEASVRVTIVYLATLRTNTTDKNWMFAKLNGVVTAYRWIPWLSRAVKFKRPNFGDPFVTDVSPRVRVHLTSERKLVYATGGRRTEAVGNRQTFVAEMVRDFNFTASPKYKLYKATVGDIKVRVYYIKLPVATVFKWAKRSLNRYSKKVGAYPYPFFVVAETQGGTGMESPGLIWIPAATKSSNLAYLIAHETAHQWFYAVVGSDQAAEPYADEAPADFLARDLLSARRSSKCARSVLDGQLYNYIGSCYYEVIYIQGGNYLHAYRNRVGDAAFWAGMRAYYKEYGFKLGGTRQLLAALDAAAGVGLAGGHEQRFPSLFSGK